MTDDLITLEVDGQTVQARRGQMLIEVTDAVDKYVPRFCYHEKLSIAANCRMCLVEVEKAPKPLPACATPVTEGMKVFTRSRRAISAQKATMEFLLINHPLDCPICDQGGECELQDLAMGYGRDVSRYTEKKRVVKDKNIGPLISTDMTRCIHCTRCVRFGQEIAGIQELGTTDRGENMEIGTYIEKSVDHELSGNIIDLCPVGALNNKPYRYSARAWEMLQRPTVSPHDCVGSNLYAHVLRGTIKRIVPKQNEEINETWLSDRDRFSYEGIYSEDRLGVPMVKDGDGSWREADWDEALAAAAKALQTAAEGWGGESIGMLASPSSTLEELFLLRRLADHLGTANIDHRIRQRDFSAQDADPPFPWLGLSIAELQGRDAIGIIGGNVRKDVPILAHRLRMAALGGTEIGFIDQREHEYRFRLRRRIVGELTEQLAAVAKAVGVAKDALPASLRDRLAESRPEDAHEDFAGMLTDAERPALLIGNVASRHPGFSAIRAIAAAIASKSGATFGYITEGSNSAGAALIGALPHRKAAGETRESSGLHASAMLQNPLQAYLLLQIEPDRDLAEARSIDSLGAAKAVIACTSFVSDSLRELATVLLPIGTFAETPGTYINVEARWQSFDAVARAVAESRPAWKVLRVLGDLLGATDIQYVSSEAVLTAIRTELGSIEPDNSFDPKRSAATASDANGIGDRLEIPIYQIDALVRRAHALQHTADGEAGRTWRGLKA